MSRTVLFLCTGNSCRSIIAEALFNKIAPAGSGWRALSAGSKPTGVVHPGAIAVLQKHDIATANCESKSWNTIAAAADATKPNAIIAVCSAAAAETCPVLLLGKGTVRVRWPVDDPAHIADATEQQAAFEAVFEFFSARISSFFRKLESDNNTQAQDLTNEALGRLLESVADNAEDPDE
jgi:arsenate reductase